LRGDYQSQPTSGCSKHNSSLVGLQSYHSNLFETVNNKLYLYYIMYLYGNICNIIIILRHFNSFTLVTKQKALNIIKVHMNIGIWPVYQALKSGLWLSLSTVVLNSRD